MSSNSEEDISGPSLKELVTKNLEANGILGKLQAQLRASVFLILEEEFNEKKIPFINAKSQQLLSSPVGKLAVAIIQDFLQCLSLDFSLSVFCPESKSEVVEKSVNRQTIKSRLGSTLNTCNLKDPSYPFLFQVIETALQLKNQKSDNQSDSDKVPNVSNEATAPDRKAQLHGETRTVKSEECYDKEIKSLKNIRNRNEAQRTEKSTTVEEDKSTPEYSSHMDKSESSTSKLSNPSISNQANHISETNNSNPPSISNSSISDKETLSGPEREYDDEFSSLSDLNPSQGQLNALQSGKTSEQKDNEYKKGGTSRSDEEKTSNDEKSEIDEFIEEEDEFSVDLLSSNSAVSNQTKDLTASKETSLADYEESV